MPGSVIVELITERDNMAYELLSEAQPATAATETAPSRSPVFRSKANPENPSLPGVTTLYEGFTASVKKFKDQPLLGHRPIDADGNALPYVWITYGETADRSAAIASSLAAAGLTKSNRVAVFGANCPEWMVAMQVCASVCCALVSLAFWARFDRQLLL